MKKILATILGALSFLWSITIPMSLAQASATTLKYVQTPTITLYSSISATATSLRVTPYPKDLNGVKLTITDFGSNPTLTIDPKVTNYEEIVGFSAIVDNGDNTATLTGLIRGYSSKSPYTASGTGKTHGASSIVVFSNNPQLYNRLAAKENDESITGLWTFSQTPIGINPGGQPNSSETVNGVGQLANGAQAAAGTSAGSTGARLLLPASLATSTCQVATTSILVTPVGTGKLATGCLDTSGTNTWTGANTYNTNVLTSNAGILATASSTFTASTTLTATTSIAASASAKLSLNTVPVVFPSSQCASGQVWSNDGSGNLSCANNGTWSLLVSTTTTAVMTTASTTVPAATNLRVDLYVPSATSEAQCMSFNFDGGSTYGIQTLENGVASNIGASTILKFNSSSSASTTDAYISANIYNAAAKRKLIFWSELMTDSTTHLPRMISGSGVWNNTSAQISSIQFVQNGACAGTSFPVGTNIRIYGSTS